MLTCIYLFRFWQHFMWQDDEERKADKWYNDYEIKRNDIVARENKVVAYVRSGV